MGALPQVSWQELPHRIGHLGHRPGGVWVAFVSIVLALSGALAGLATDTRVITDAALELLTRFDQDRVVRLVGVRAEMEPPAAGSDPG